MRSGDRVELFIGKRNKIEFYTYVKTTKNSLSRNRFLNVPVGVRMESDLGVSLYFL